jgi:hypothetical protein
MDIVFKAINRINDRFTLLQVIVIETVRTLRQKLSEDLSNPT